MKGRQGTSAERLHVYGHADDVRPVYRSETMQAMWSYWNRVAGDNDRAGNRTYDVVLPRL